MISPLYTIVKSIEKNLMVVTMKQVLTKKWFFREKNDIVRIINEFVSSAVLFINILNLST